jgi:uncharacterized protein
LLATAGFAYNPPLMLSLFPEHADPERLCALGKVYEGDMALSELPRLADSLVDATGSARFRLEFGKDGENRSVVDVEVKVELHLRCQRCLEGYLEPVSTRARLALVNGPVEAERLPEELDPLLVEDERVSLRALIEDELILAVPNAPMHATEACLVDLAMVNAVSDDLEENSGADRRSDSPFAALASLKGGGDAAE